MIRLRIASGLALCILAGTAHGGIGTTVHNLSVSGPGTIKAASEAEICVFCHTPHNSSPSGPLWNRHDPGTTYTPYNSTTIQAAPGQPSGVSILCLSCHDGTIALGDLISRPGTPMQGGITTMPPGPTNLGTDLSDDHPISFVYADSYAGKPTEFVPPGALTGPVHLDAAGRLQCTSCHEPHDNTFGKFLVTSNAAGALCVTCHLKYGWDGPASHKTSGAIWNDMTVAERACENCHLPHTAGNPQRLLRQPEEEANCSVCHDGSVARTNIMGEFGKMYRHPIMDTRGVHDPVEPAIVDQRHVECFDCHNPHAASSSGSPAGPLLGVRGVSSTGSEVPAPPGIAFEYQLCFRCHADSPGKPPPPTARQFPETNVRNEFSTAGPSYHPVVGEGRNPDVPSLIPPLDTASIIKCTDCHNNDDLSGARGPHGSIYPTLLEREYRTQDGTTESAAAYAMCYKCHDRTSILGNDSFPLHRFHITGDGGMGHGGGPKTPCNVCHDPHGSQQVHLVNFDVSVVSPSSSGRLEHYSTGTFSGGCYLSCHGQNHNPCTYGGMGRGCMGMGGGAPP